MAPSATLQDRIRQFESLDGARSSKLPSRERPRSSYPPVQGYQASFMSSAASNSSSDPLGEPISPTIASYTIIKPSVPYMPRKPRIKSPSPSPPNLGCNTSLIDLKDWVVEDGPNSRMRSSQAAGSRHGVSKVAIAPTLPPRKTSQNSVTSESTSSVSRSPNNATSSMLSRSSSNSLTVEHTYPPLSKMSSKSNMRKRQGHVAASSTSSFHSVSLSSDGDTTTDGTGTDGGSSVSNFIATYPMDKEAGIGNGPEEDRDSVDDSFSFETVSSVGVSSPTLSSTHEWEKDFSVQSIKPEPPRLPSRCTPLIKPPSSPALSSPSFSPILSSSQRTSQPSSPIHSVSRRVPPPTPSRFTKPPPSTSSRASLMSTTTSASDRSSIFSNATITTTHTSIGSYTQLLRPMPVPLVARKRYEAVFFANVNSQRRVTVNKLSPSTAASSTSSSLASPTTPRKGWRGLSVDLITNPEDNPLLSGALEEEAESSRLEGQVVRSIWSKSKLLSEKLRDIWNECALPGQASLDKDGFVKGMWRIDDELRRAQSARISSMISANKSRRATDFPLLH